DHGQLLLRCRAGSSGWCRCPQRCPLRESRRVDWRSPGSPSVADELAEILGPENVGEVRVWPAEVEVLRILDTGEAEQGALSTLDGTARVLNASSTDSAAKEVSDLSNRLGGLMEKLPREFNVSKIREETRQTRADVAKLTQQADQVMSETQRLQASASGLTEQLSRAQSGIQPSDEALKSADEALDAVDNNTAKMSKTLTGFHQQVDEANTRLANLQNRRANSQKFSLEQTIASLNDEQSATARNLTAIDEKLNSTLATAATSGGIKISEAEQLRRSGVINQLQKKLQLALARVGSDQGILASLELRTSNLEKSMENASREAGCPAEQAQRRPESGRFAG
uniref:MCE family protein n=1 Tax=Macrostomum lignano TaxID=282301 RepID=A0A1I8JQT2_9PLAT